MQIYAFRIREFHFAVRFDICGSDGLRPFGFKPERRYSRGMTAYGNMLKVYQKFDNVLFDAGNGTELMENPQYAQQQ